MSQQNSIIMMVAKDLIEFYCKNYNSPLKRQLNLRLKELRVILKLDQLSDDELHILYMEARNMSRLYYTPNPLQIKCIQNIL